MTMMTLFRRPQNFNAAADGGGSSGSTSCASATAIGSPSSDSSSSSLDYICRTLKGKNFPLLYRDFCPADQVDDEDYRHGSCKVMQCCGYEDAGLVLGIRLAEDPKRRRKWIVGSTTTSLKKKDDNDEDKLSKQAMSSMFDSTITAMEAARSIKR
ncbi:uncharacterized protein G2W53_005397 [Senna tora]|uniref:Uncharacterized protein n=1 Tax=Senna tora TaxID=362788 RepID=A0A834X208_9FABA|nr:uncharacterized protein G2W53_005397 [Senna tora]